MQWAVRSALSQSNTSGARISAEQLALLLEAAAAAVVSAAMHGPFGELERATGHRLQRLRLASALLLTGAALGAVAAGVAGTAMPEGGLAVARDTAGMIGIGLLLTVLVGGHFAWVGPTGYFVIAAYAVADKWTSPLDLVRTARPRCRRRCVRALAVGRRRHLYRRHRYRRPRPT